MRHPHPWEGLGEGSGVRKQLGQKVWGRGGQEDHLACEELLTGHTGDGAHVQKARAVLQTTTFRPQVTCPQGEGGGWGGHGQGEKSSHPPTAPHPVLWGLQNLRQ